MSSILKALKKLEREKAARKEGHLDLSREILRDKPVRERTWTWQRPVALASLILALLSGILLLRPWRTPVTTAKTDQVSPRLPSPPPVAQTPTRPVAPEPPATPPALKASRPVPATSFSTRLPALVRETTGSPAPVPGKAATIPVPLPPLASPLPSRQDTAQSPAPLQPATQPGKVSPVLGGKTGPATAAPVSSGSTLQVSGIAWQKDSADRLAVINGIPLVIGDIIEGAQVREILPDRVRFATKEKSFEIFLGKSAKVN